MKHWCALLMIAMAGCEGSDGGAGASSASSTPEASSAKGSASVAPAAAPAPKKERNFQDVQKIHEEVFKPGRTATAAGADEAIAEFIQKVGEPDKVEGDKSYWYAKYGDSCMEVWTKKGAGSGFGGTDKSKCGL